MTVHVTPAGTTWTSRSHPLGEHGNARWMVADRSAGERRVPTILFLHGAGHEEDAFERSALWSHFRHQLMDEGWAVIEGRGGASDLARANWGAPASRLAYRNYLEHVAGQLDLGPLVVLGRSMGGIGASNLFLHDPVVSQLARGLMVHQAVCNLRAIADVPEGGNDGSGKGKFWPAVWQAWGIDSRESFLAASADSDPMRFAPEAWAGTSVWVGVATGDQTVPAEDHGLALRRRWAGHPRLDRVSTRLGGNHTTEGLYDAVETKMSFLYAVTRTSPPTAQRHRIVSRSRWSGTEQQLVTDRQQWSGERGGTSG